MIDNDIVTRHSLHRKPQRHNVKRINPSRPFKRRSFLIDNYEKDWNISALQQAIILYKLNPVQPLERNFSSQQHPIVLFSSKTLYHIHKLQLPTSSSFITILTAPESPSITVVTAAFSSNRGTRRLRHSLLIAHHPMHFDCQETLPLTSTITGPIHSLDMGRRLLFNPVSQRRCLNRFRLLKTYTLRDLVEKFLPKSVSLPLAPNDLNATLEEPPQDRTLPQSSRVLDHLRYDRLEVYRYQRHFRFNP
ncbi:hypothetical protein TNIN_400531 [Trichonephila inaurata madagascariensis]|uniref:Uncharacterized protein n=1 Tax=Trichonephila inaurata madagascariensis TaxID=2747483 RepID=A0A8X6WZT0_9ARAC|nr:hypothetical protein TNIN_400531 [Trichonephila inaurata madagascariensis]